MVSIASCPNDRSVVPESISHRCSLEREGTNERRLQLMQLQEGTRYSNTGVIALDNTLIDHDGQLIDDVGWFWDHAEERHKIAHDYLFINYVCTSGKHYP